MSEDPQEPVGQPSRPRAAASLLRIVLSFLWGFILTGVAGYGIAAFAGQVVVDLVSLFLPDGAVTVFAIAFVSLVGIAVGGLLWRESRGTNPAFARGAIVGAVAPLLITGACSAMIHNALSP